MQRQSIRDLRWVLETPSLIDDPLAVPTIRFEPEAIDPDELDAFLTERASHRVGRYFESLVLFWLERIRKVEIVAHGHQIRDGNRTIGEIDFLFRDEEGRLNHWEAAVKFFLHCPQPTGSHFPGPNAKDNFERKVSKLFDKQLPLSKEHFSDVDIRKAFVRGVMFYHPNVGEPDTLPYRLAGDHQRGRWIRSSELKFLEQPTVRSFVIVPKPTWLAAPQTSPATIGELENHFARFDFPMMLSVIDEAKEERRMFVVPETWPTA